MPVIPSKKPKILITGCGGMLGHDIYKHFSRSYAVLATDKNVSEPWLKRLDVTNETEFFRIAEQFKPDYIFHLAAETDLERCELDPAYAFNVNAKAVETAARVALVHGALLVYISTANVFDGQKESGYKEEDEVCPVNVYGRSKLQGEEYAKKMISNYLILRAGWMIGGGPQKDKKFVNMIIGQIADGKRELKIVNGKSGSLTYTKFFAAAIESLIKKGVTGTYHVACRGYCTRLEIARQIVKYLRLTRWVSVKEVGVSYFNHEFFAQRPLSEHLNVSALEKTGVTSMRSWEEALADYVRSEYSNHIVSKRLFVMKSLWEKLVNFANLLF